MFDFGKKYKILMIDSDTFMTDEYVKEFSKRGMDVRVMYNGDDKDFFDKVAEYNPDLISMNVVFGRGLDSSRLAKHSGFDLMAKMNLDERFRSKPIFILSNETDPDSLRKSRSLGAVEYLVISENTPETVVNKYINFLNTK